MVEKVEYTTDELGYECYIVYLVPYVAPKEAPTAQCNHTYEWSLEVDATATEDGLEAYRCTQCGHVAAYTKTSAAGAFVKETLEKIIKAKAGDTLLIETDRWTCFPQSVMQTIADRRDITITIQYKLEGKKYQITIPADAAVPTDVPFAGFDEYLAGLYGKEEVVK